jgi:hypothetical protein
VREESDATENTNGALPSTTLATRRHAAGTQAFGEAAETADEESCLTVARRRPVDRRGS